MSRGWRAKGEFVTAGQAPSPDVLAFVLALGAARGIATARALDRQGPLVRAVAAAGAAENRGVPFRRGLPLATPTATQSGGENDA